MEEERRKAGDDIFVIISQDAIPNISSSLMDEATPLGLSRQACIYTQCYCEENIWKLCKHLEESRGKDVLTKGFAVFISNGKRIIPLWKQVAAESPEQPVFWDYHVILLYKSNSRTMVYDLDTTLSFPCTLEEYSRLGLRSEEFMVSEYHRLFRVIPGELFLTTFASDRSHMKNQDGTWKASPPSYPCISTNETSMNLDDFIDMSKTDWHGDVLTLPELLDRFKDDT